MACFFGMAGSKNDLNVLDHSPVFDEFLQGRTPPNNYMVNGQEYSMGYYLTDGIYSKYASFVEVINSLTTSKKRLFTQKQEAARKDVERVWSVTDQVWHNSKTSTIL